MLTERCYVIGNTSVGESWRSDPGNLKGSLEYHDAECCVAYNLMKLERHVFAGPAMRAGWMPTNASCGTAAWARRIRRD